MICRKFKAVCLDVHSPKVGRHPPLKNVERDGSRGCMFVCCLIWFYVDVECMFLGVDVFCGDVCRGKMFKSVQCFRVNG